MYQKKKKEKRKKNVQICKNADETYDVAKRRSIVTYPKTRDSRKVLIEARGKVRPS